MSHTCHAFDCTAPCPPRWLMCRRHWATVPPEMQAEVYRTVRLRGQRRDASWAPWWRAQSEARCYVGASEGMDTSEDLKRGNEVADRLEQRGAKGHE